MDRINDCLLFLVIGIFLVHTVTAQAAPATSTNGKKTDQSTIVWAVSTDAVDPTTKGGGAGGSQAEVSTVPPVINPPVTKESAVVIVTTPASVRQETTTKLMTPAPVDVTTVNQNVLTQALPTSPPRATDPAIPNIKTDVTDTVMALLNETGYSASANDANVQEIVHMLMNGSVPTDADLMRLGIVPEPAPIQLTTLPPYSIPVNPPVMDTSVAFPAINMPPVAQTGSTGPIQTGNSAGMFPSGGFPMNSFPVNPPVGPPMPQQTGPSTGTGGGSGTDPFAGALSSIGTGSGGFPNFPPVVAVPETTPKPMLADPFGMNTIGGGALPGLLPPPLPGLGAMDPNALGPKPFPNVGPVGGLGTPGSPTDLLGSIGPTPGGLGSLPPPQTGILDSALNRNRNQNSGMNNLMMMMMMNPEMMDQMMSGENPMLTYLMMQQFNRRPQRRRPTPAPGLGPLGGLGGLSGGPAGAGAGLMPLPLPGGSPLGAGGAGGLMDIMGSVGGGALPPAGLGQVGAPPMDLAALTGLGAGLGAGGVGPLPGLPGATSMNLIPGSLTNPTGIGAGPADVTPFLNMINPGSAGPLPSGAPLTDPFAPTVG